MPRLTGGLGDGWLPSPFCVGLDALPGRNVQNDDAALAAGRNPAAIRLLLDITGTFAAIGVGYLNGGPQCEELSELLTVHGDQHLILWAADPDAFQRFAHEVAPGSARVSCGNPG